MRILHTSDWHIGKRLSRVDRMEEHAAAIDEVVAIADTEKVDVVVHSGDLFDRSVPPLDALQLGLDGLVRLATGGARPVVVTAGNHDSPELFATLAPFLEPFGVHLRGEILPPTEGGVVELETAGGRAHVACLPFLREGRIVDFMADTGEWYGQYADKIRRLAAAYADHLRDRGEGAVSILAAHFLVTGARVGGHGATRGERELHMGEAYTVDAGAIPPSLSYVAMGHIHAPQPVPGANVPAEYAGSLLQLDFGEAGEDKRVVIVDAEPGRPASIRSIPVTSGRPLMRVRGSLGEIKSRDDLAGAHLDLEIETDGPSPGLDVEVREAFPQAVKIRAVYERGDLTHGIEPDLPWDDVYAHYHNEVHGREASEPLMAAFRAVWEATA